MDRDSISKFRRPTFCGHLYRERNYHSMQIPNEFLNRIKDKIPDTAILNGPWGGSWPIKVRHKVEGVFLEDGWRKFVVDHKLYCGAFLLFRYYGNWHFNVEIFTHDGLEVLDGGENCEAGPSGVKGKKGDQENKNFTSPTDQVPKFHPACSGESKNKRRAKWKDQKLAEMFLDLCLQEAAIARTDKGNLSRESWDKIQQVFQQEKGINFTTVQLENRWSFLKGKYTAWSKIIAYANAKGEYDLVANKVNWSLQQWEEYVKAYPEAKVFLNKSPDHLGKMQLLFDL